MLVCPKHISLKPAGHTFLSHPDNALIEHDTLQCVHCGMHWEIKPGSGKERGFCLKCMGPTCGKQQCEASCIPDDMRVEEPHKIILPSGVYL